MIVAILLSPVIVALILYVLQNAGYISGTFPTWIHTAAADAGGYIKGLNYIFDTGELFIALTIIVGLEAVILVWKSIRWYIGLLRGNNG